MAPHAPDDSLASEHHEHEHEHEHDDERNPHASANRWRHEESSAYARYERTHHPHSRGNASTTTRGPVARDAESRGGGVSDLADFLNQSRIEPPAGDAARSRPTTARFKPVVAGASEARAAAGLENGAAADGAAQQNAPPPPDGKEVVCGPLLNYRRMEGANWVGSVLVVTAGGGSTQPIVPTLNLRRVGGGGGGVNGADAHDVQGVCLHSDSRNTFWRFDLQVEMQAAEAQWEYELPELRLSSETKPRANRFFVPAVDESMRIMFHSCNGFSVGTDEDAWSGPALWNDVMRRHQERPFHVM